MVNILSKVFGVTAEAAAGPVGPVADLIGGILNKVLPDKQANDAAKAALAEAALSGQLAQVQGQLAINLAEAQNKSVWVAGWRPAFGWVGAVGLAYQMILRPLLTFAVHLAGKTWDAPSIELQDLIGLCGTMLGFGIMRSVDKVSGSSSGH